ncbi:MAG: hypothetical protein J6P83_02735 [Bacteroidales bacterium]|nr:hypothetical protein [Bacteroidales bacterium]
MKKGILVAVFALFVSIVPSFAQAFFPTEKDAFYDKLSSYLNSSTAKKDRDEAAVIMQAFKGAWDSYYTDSEAQMVMRLCELLHARTGGKAYANIFNYIEVLQKIPTAGLTHKDVNNWLCYTDTKTQKSLNGVDKYLASCRSIFVDKVLSAKGNSQWTLRDALWSFPSKEKFELSIDGTLALVSQKDESVLKNTKGVYYLDDNRWEGTGGRADWSRFDISPEKVYVTLPDFYELDLNRSEYAIDSVIFHENQHFHQDILCRFEDKVLVNAPNEKTMFPRVKSYRSDYAITNLMRNIDFEGGIGMMGNQVDVFGGVSNKAVFHFRQEGREVVRVQAPRFLMSMDELLVSNNVAMRVYLIDSVSGSEMDSIYHNDIGFRYDNKTRQMTAFRSEKDFGDAPFHDYFHGVDIFLEAMYWDIDGNQVDFRRMEGVNPVSEGDVVSVNYFRHDDFKRLQGLDGSHPMIRVEKFLQGFDNVDRQVKFAVGDLASYLHYPIEQVISLLLRLQAEGYVEYDAETKWATALPRFFDVIDSYRETIDYDVIKLHTLTTNRQPNLRLDLRTNDLLVYGITSQIVGVDGSAISLSDRKRVVIVPDFGRITFTKNQNFKFSGGILAGMFEFFTKDSEFNYEDFAINMEKVDSLRFYARYDNHIIPVDGTLEKLKGRLEIDHGDNKSSRYETPDYPIFRSEKEAFKFYRKINGGVFNPGSVDSVMTAEDLDGKFFYSVYPFVVDSLNDLSMTKVRFEGELVSGGIMPNIEQPLVVMEDFSLGFVHQIGEGETASYPLYGDLGRFHNKVYLSQSGFFGEGKLDYQTAAFRSDQFMFYLDSVTAITNQFKMVPREDGTGFPMATADALRLKWDIGIPELTTETIDNPICMYGDTYFSGKTVLSPDGYSADGKMRFGLTEFDSDHFALDSRTFVADSAQFLLYSADTSNIAFAATNYRANVDFDAQKVKYDYLDQTSNLDFPMNQYICSLKEAEWDMATNSLHLYNPVESFGDYATATTHEELLAIHNNASKFISLVPEQDSLQFYSMNAEYDMTNYIIHAHDVKIIRVADAAVFPYNHDVDINAESKLEPVNGDLLADTLNQFHLYKNAVVNIHSRNYYDAHGIWDYTNADGASTPIQMDTIVPVDGVTHGYAHIADNADFKLNTQFGFQGRLTLDAAEELGYFDGKFAMLAFEEIQPAVVQVLDTVAESEVTEFAEVPTDSTNMEVDVILDETGPSTGSGTLVEAAQDTIAALNHWFVSATRIDPTAIRIPVDMERIRETDERMTNGLYYELAIDGGYFGSFLTPKEGRKDLDDTEPMNGVLWFDADSLRFVVTDETKYDTYLELDNRGVINGHGTTGLGFETPLAQFVFHGDYTQYPNDSLTLQGLNIFNAPVFDDQAMQSMAEVFANVAGESIDLTQTNFLPYYRSETTEEKAEELRKNIELAGGYPQIESSSDFYCNTIVIPDLKMVWNDQLHAFVSVGKIGLGNFGGHIVNKYVTGCVVFDRRLGNITYYFQDDMFQAYLNYNSGDGQLQVHCTFSDINQRLVDTKEKNRTRTKDDKRFQYVAVPYESMLDFLNRLKYAGLSVGSF